MIRPASASDRSELARMRLALWPDSMETEVDAVLDTPRTEGLVLLAVSDERRVCGFAEFGLRRFAEGCDSSPVAYLEGIWVDDDRRRASVATALVQAGEEWAVSLGMTELASDCDIGNRGSEAFHLAVGFAEVGRNICFRRSLSPDA